MFKNRAFEVRLVKKAKNGEAAQDEVVSAIDIDPKEIVREVAFEATKMMLTYMAADTVRKVIVGRLTR